MKAAAIDRARHLYDEERRAVRPPSGMRPSEWAAKHIRFPEGYGNTRPGRLELSWSPHIIEPLDQLANPTVHEIVLVWPGRTGKSTVMTIALAYWNDEDPSGDCLWMLPNEDDASDFNSTTFQPVIRESLPHLITGKKHDDRLTQFMSSTGMITRFRGANSPAKLARFSARRVVRDEEEKNKDFLGREAGPGELAEVRMLQFADWFSLRGSTPTTEEGPIWKAYLATDQRTYHLRCIRCGAWQELVSEQVKWPKGATADDVENHGLARYVCNVESCQFAHDEDARIRMLEAGGLWVPAGARIELGQVVGAPNPNPTRVGYQLGQLATRWVTLARYAGALIRAGDDASKIQTVRNSWEALPFKQTVRHVKSAELEGLRLEAHEPGVVPEAAHRVFATVDVQAAGPLIYVVRAYGVRACWLVREGFCRGWEELEQVLSFPFPVAGTSQHVMPVCEVLIDRGDHHREAEVLNWCRPRPGRLFRVWPVVGRTLAHGKPYLISKLERGTVADLEGITINVDFFKDQLAQLIRGTLEGDSSTGWWLHKAPSPGYLHEMTGEHLVRDRKTNRARWEPKTKGRAVDRWDCEVYQQCAAHMASWWSWTAEMAPQRYRPGAPEPAVEPEPERRGRGDGVPDWLKV